MEAAGGGVAWARYSLYRSKGIPFPSGYEACCPVKERGPRFGSRAGPSVGWCLFVTEGHTTLLSTEAALTSRVDVERFTAQNHGAASTPSRQTVPEHVCG